MSKFTNRDQEYDLGRCSREQLEAYVKEILKQNGGTSHCNTGRVVLDVAKVPRETKADVARELAEYCAANFAPPGNGAIDNVTTSEFIRTLTARYRKAVA